MVIRIVIFGGMYWKRTNIERCYRIIDFYVRLTLI